ncbi:MAG: 6,7-dimethyl-8-ribityllumazine synthase [Thermoanaerobaculia bacterium]
MKDIEQKAGRLDGTGRRFAIAASRFNERIVERLVAAAVDTLVRHGARPQDVTVVRVPGAWELPHALEELAARAASTPWWRSAASSIGRDAALRLHLCGGEPRIASVGSGTGCRSASVFSPARPAPRPRSAPRQGREQGTGGGRGRSRWPR